MTEVAVLTLTGVVLGAGAGSLVGLAVPGAVVGGLNGAVGGARRIYAWRTPAGTVAFVLDSTWALVTTASALVAHLGGALRGAPGFVPGLSERRNRHVYSRGLQTRRGFAVTFGNVVNGAGDPTDARRVRLVDEHEDVHVWQSRWFGPLFPLLYLGWAVAGGLVGVVAWLAGHRRSHRGRIGLGRVVEAYGYYLNPFEWWAYSRGGAWPPTGKASGIGWRRPAVGRRTVRRGAGRAGRATPG